MVDKHDAPEGYIAVEVDVDIICKGCAFSVINCDSYTRYRSCASTQRKDKHDVIFVKEPTVETERAMQDVINGKNVEEFDLKELEALHKKKKSKKQQIKAFKKKVNSLLVRVNEIENKLDELLERS